MWLASSAHSKVEVRWHLSPLRHHHHPPLPVLCRPPDRRRRPLRLPPRLQPGRGERSFSGSDRKWPCGQTNDLLPTIPVVFLVLFVHLVFLLVIYVWLAVLIILLEKEFWWSERGTQRNIERFRQEVQIAVPSRWWRCPCRSPYPPGASYPSGPAGHKHRGAGVPVKPVPEAAGSPPPHLLLLSVCCNMILYRPRGAFWVL